MKINWGTGIALFYSIFVLVLVWQVYKSTQYDHSLVSDEYYADDLNYQKHYNRLVNYQDLDEQLLIAKTEEGSFVELSFPEELTSVKGDIHFFCPSDSQQDFKLRINTSGTSKQKVPVEGLKTGMWRVKVNFEAGGKTFYKEEVIII